MTPVGCRLTACLLTGVQNNKMGTGQDGERSEMATNQNDENRGQNGNMSSQNSDI